MHVSSLVSISALRNRNVYIVCNVQKIIFLNLILPEKTFCNSINSLNNNSPTSDHIILNSSDNTNKNK